MSGLRSAASRLIQHKATRLLLKVLLSVGLLGVIVYFVDFRELVRVLTHMDLWLLVPIVAMVYIDRLVSAYKWNPLLHALGVRVPFSLLFRVYMLAPLAALVIPISISRDGFRLYMLSRHRVDNKAVFASIVTERVIGFVSILTLAFVSFGVASYLLRNRWENFAELGVLIALGALLAVALVGVALGGPRRLVSSFAARLGKYPLVVKAHQIYTLYSEYRNHKRTVAYVAAITFVEQMAPIFITFLLAIALHIEVSLIELFAVIPFIVLAVRLPVPLEGVGITEGLAIVLLGLVGVSATEAVVLAFLGRVLQFVPTAPAAIYYIFKGRRSLFPEPTAVAADLTQTEP